MSLFIIFSLSSLLILSFCSAHFHPCNEPFLILTQQNNISKCRRLTTLGAEFGWEINPNNEQEIHILFGVKLYSKFGWIAWGVNPNEMPQMVGTRAIIGVIYDNGSTYATTYNITSDTKLGCKLRPTKFEEAEDEVFFRNISMEYRNFIDMYMIQATVILPRDIPGYNDYRLNHVWQVGYGLDDKYPKNHPTILQNVDSSETINLKTGWGRHVGEHRRHLRLVHGILNVIGWGTFLPGGVIIARYFKYPFEKFQKRRRKLHVYCQFTGYILGTAGWVVGLCLGYLSKFYAFRIHGLYSVFIFAFTTLQVLAIRLRPKKTDEYRKYWNMYHHILGYGLLAVISMNIFRGINILKPENKTWRRGYIGILIAFAAIVTALEIYSWIKFKRNQKKNRNICNNNIGTAESGGRNIVPTIPQPRH